MKLLTSTEHTALPDATEGGATAVALANDADPLALSLDGVSRIDLHFPKFTDGRAYSQAFLLRRRRSFAGEIRATGDVLVDQLAQMARSGFDVAVLRADQPLERAQHALATYPGYAVKAYQGDAVQTAPHFARTASGQEAAQAV